MRILHTGDWHMNHRLGRIPMAALIQDAIRQIAAYLRIHEVDVLVIAGDLFCGKESREQLGQSVSFLKETFGPFLVEGGTILAISGNHDSETFFMMLRDAFDLVAPIREDEEGIHGSGRFYVAPNPRVLTLRGRNGQPVQFVLMPYPTPRCYLYGEDVRFKSINERNAAMAQVFRETMTTLCRSKIKPELPAVLVSHAQVRGVPVSDLFIRGEEDDVIVEVGDLPAYFVYGAYGHIHRQDSVMPGESQFRYCGSLLPLDAAEQGQRKAVLLVEIREKRLARPPESLPILGPRLLDLTFTPDEIGSLRDRFPDCETALVKYRLRYDPNAGPDPFPLHEQVRAIFPGWYDGVAEPIRPGDSGANTEDGSPFRHQLDDVRGTVLGYLKQIAMWGKDDADQEDVIALAESLLVDSAFMSQIQEVN